MSERAETFYAIQCDFPGCDTVYENDAEAAYGWDPYEHSEYAEESGWLIGDGDSKGQDFCPVHTVDVPCPHGGCDKCRLDWPHLVPAEDTFETRLRIALDGVYGRAFDDLDRLGDRMVRASDRVADAFQYRLKCRPHPVFGGGWTREPVGVTDG